MTIAILMLDGRLNATDVWGLLPTFLSEDNPKSAIEQFDAAYGWDPMDGFTLDKKTMTLSYPGDPPMRPLSVMKFRDEYIFVYPHELVMVADIKRNTWAVARMN